MAETQDLLGAIREGDAAGVRTLLEAAPELAAARDENGVSLMLQALYQGRRDLADLFLATGHAPDLYEAAALGDADRLREFLVADPAAVDGRSADGFAPLHLAAFFGHAAVAGMLLDAGAGVDSVANNAMAVRPLHSAAAGQHEEVVALLLDRGADPNTRQAGGYTPLMSAAGTGNVAIITALLAAGADASITADDGRTAETLATERGHAEVIPRLREGKC